MAFSTCTRKESRPVAVRLAALILAATAISAAGRTVTDWRVSDAAPAIEEGRVNVTTADPATIKHIRWLQSADRGLTVLGAGKLNAGDRLLAAPAFQLEDNQGYQVNIEKLRMTGERGWKTLFVALMDGDGNQVGFSLGSPGGGFIYSQDPAWRSHGHDFKFQLPFTLILQRRDGMLEFGVDGRRIFAIPEPETRTFDRLALRVARQHPADSVLAELAPVAVVSASRFPEAKSSTAGKRATPPAPTWFPVPEEQPGDAPTVPSPSTFPRIVLLHNMWWSGPSSPRFIAGGVAGDPHPGAGHYENAPLISAATLRADGRRITAPGEGMNLQIFRDAEAAGIDAVIYDCFTDGPSAFISLFRMAEAARHSGSDVDVLPCVDRMDNEGLDFLKHFWLFRDKESGKRLRDHPNLLRTGQCPVVFEYHKATPEVWAERLERARAVGGNFFIVTHGSAGIQSAVLGQVPESIREHIAAAPGTYLFSSHSAAFGNPDPVADLLQIARSFDPPKAVGGTVAPGYIGTTRVGNLLDPRGTWVYREGWLGKIRHNPDFVQLPTGNDYSEATEQECSANSTFTFIDMTRYFGTRWRTGEWPELNTPQAFLSYRSAVTAREAVEVELVLLRPDIAGDEAARRLADRFQASCSVQTSTGETVTLPTVEPRARMGHVVWRFQHEEGLGRATWARPQVRIHIDGAEADLPDGPAAAFCVMRPGEELARKWLRVPLHRIHPEATARVRVAGNPENLYPRTVRVEGLAWEKVAGGVFLRNGLHSLWYTLSGKVLRNGFVERFNDAPGYAPMRYEDGWKKRRVLDRTDRYTAVVRMRDDTFVYPQPEVLAAPHVDPATVMDLMIPPPLTQLGPPVGERTVRDSRQSANLLRDRGPVGNHVKLPSADSPARPVIRRDAPDAPWHLRFDGKDDRLKTGALTMPPGPVTVEMRLRFRRTDRTQVIFDQWGVAMGIGLTSRGTLVLARTNQKRNVDWLEGETKLVPERWYRIAGTFDGRELRLYVDGALEGKPLRSHGLRTDENTVIGSGSGTLAQLAGMHERIDGPFGGDLVRLRVLQRALPKDEMNTSP